MTRREELIKIINEANIELKNIDESEKISRKKEGCHDFSGNFSPKEGFTWNSQDSFSLGIFQWVKKSSRNGLKKSPVKFRIKGKISNADKIYEQARLYCSSMDCGYTPKTKSMTI